MKEKINNSINYILDRIIYPTYEYAMSLLKEC